ncbi:MAG: cytochrome C [Bacteroidetes bacterium]|nr:MAG: cytochrome C [Bacteroidota bacterium]
MPLIFKNMLVNVRKAWVFLALSFAPMWASAQPKTSDLSNPLVQVMVIIMVLLLLGIAILANVVKGAAELYIRKQASEAKEAKSSTPVATIMLVFMLLGSLAVSAQTEASPAPAASIGGVSPTVFYLLAGVIFAELLVMIMLANQLRSLVNPELKKAAKPHLVAAQQPKESWWWRINKAYALEKEKDIDLNHDYDGIRELDNSVPPWWLLAFVCSILFGGVYLWRYHVAETAPLQTEEFNIAMQKAELQKAAYLKKAASNVDENSIAMLDATGIEAGKGLFAQNCVACHGAKGEGAAVGPNLTDDYWIHGGSLQSIFKTIKYGVTEKGMRAWKEDMTPAQMAQLTSYVNTLKGTNPPNAKAPQGELYSDAPKPDSTGMIPTK